MKEPMTPQQKQNNTDIPDRRLARKVGANYTRLTQAMRRLQRNPNIKLLSPDLFDAYMRYIGGSVDAATKAVKMGGQRYFQESLNQDPPMMMVLKRKGIRIFPDGKRVALYVNEKLGLTFTVPYSSKGSENPMVGVTEEVEEILENIEHIKNIVANKQAKKLKFADGSSMNVDLTTASAIHNVHNALNDENRDKFAKMLGHSREHFSRAADFSLKQHKFVIDK